MKSTHHKHEDAIYQILIQGEYKDDEGSKTFGSTGRGVERLTVVNGPWMRGALAENTDRDHPVHACLSVNRFQECTHLAADDRE